MKHRKPAKRTKPASSKGNPRKLNPNKIGGGNVRGGRRYGPGGRVTRAHN